MRINHNIAALNTHRQLNFNNAGAGKSLEKLSSGLRINRAGDDAAGLAISEKMRGQIRGLDQAARNSQDGISLIQTAEGALNETHSILQRMKELASQAANDTNTLDDRKEIQKEINQLTSEINRIGNTTEFNTQKVLNGGAQVTNVGVTATTPPSLGTPVGAITNGATVPGSAHNAGGTVGSVEFTIGTALEDGDSFEVAGQTITVYADAAALAAANGNTGDAYGIVEDTAANQASAIAALFTGDVTGDATGATVTLTQAVAGTGDVSAVDNTGVTTGAVAQDSQVNGAAHTTGGVAASTSFTISTALGAGDSFDVAGQTITVYADAAALAAANGGTGDTYGIVVDTADNQASAIAALFTGGTTGSATGATVTLTASSVGTGTVAATSALSGSNSTPGVYSFSVATQVAAGGSYTIDGNEILVVDDADAADYTAEIAAGTVILAGADANEQATNLIAAINANAALSTTGTGNYTAAAGTGSAITLTQTTANTTAPVITTNAQAGATGEFSATLQIGANQGQNLRITIADMRSQILGISSTTAGSGATGVDANVIGALFSEGTGNELSDVSTTGTAEYALDVSTHESASAAITVLDQAIKTVSSERSKLGAVQNRLEHTINNLGAASENLTAAESRIRDVDMAKEMMEFTKNNILTQAAQAMLAQANQQPQGVLQLLR